MTTLILTQDDLPGLLPMDDCRELMARTLRTVAEGDAIQPLRSGMWLPSRAGLLGLMPGYLGSPQVMGVKVISVFPGNRDTPYDSHQGAILLYEVDHGQLLALVDATAVTAIRTAAVSAVATQALARPEASDLALLGSGVQAVTHLEAMLGVRPVERIRVWSRDPDHAADFAKREGERHGCTIEVAGSAQEAVDGAHLVCTLTSASEPVLHGAWLAAGAHVNAVGSCTPKARELDAESLARSSLFVDSRESALSEAGDLLLAQAEGALGQEPIEAELGEVLTGTHAGREGPDEITVFESLGLAVEDLAAAHLAWQQAVERGVGTPIDLGGRRD